MKRGRAPDGPSGRPNQRHHFRERYDQVEQRRDQLLAQLTLLGERGRAHPSYKAAQTLLTRTFRTATVAQRIAVLAAAEWIIDLIYTSMNML